PSLHSFPTRRSSDLDAEAYLERLRNSPEELAELIDAVVVPETWFFRDRGAFSVLERFVREEAAAKHPLRLLSFPCATGEEPYSIDRKSTRLNSSHLG